MVIFAPVFPKIVLTMDRSLKVSAQVSAW
jgi:hypothetical protein